MVSSRNTDLNSIKKKFFFLNISCHEKFSNLNKLWGCSVFFFVVQIYMKSGILFGSEGSEFIKECGIFCWSI
jgi:hypothetical protein